MENHGKQRRSYQYLESLWRPALPINKTVATITTEQVERILTHWWRKETRSGSTFNRALDQLSGFLSWCYRKRYIAPHPIRGRFERLPSGKTRRGYLKQQWREPLLAECVELAREKTPDADPQWLANHIRFGSGTGMRKGKLQGRTTSHLEHHGKRVFLRIGKDKNGDTMLQELLGDCLDVALARAEAARFAKKPLLLLPGPNGGRADSSVRGEVDGDLACGNDWPG